MSRIYELVLMIKPETSFDSDYSNIYVQAD